jgi:hypothetical protein
MRVGVIESSEYNEEEEYVEGYITVIEANDETQEITELDEDEVYYRTDWTDESMYPSEDILVVFDIVVNDGRREAHNLSYR